MNPLPLDSRATGRLSRRAVIKVAAVGLLGSAAGAGGSALITRVSRATPSPYRFFSVPEADLLSAICEQIIPRDDAPGATDAGVIHFIDRQLVGRLARHQQTYRRGLDALRQTCLAEFKAPFTDLSPEQKLALLRRLEAGKTQKDFWSDPSAPQFFRLVVSHTMQGFYGPPRHGGNRGYTSYRMLGLDYPQVIGQNRPPRATS